jgi:hypothetical protein
MGAVLKKDSVMECRFCGRPTEIVLDGEPICEECYENAGSCCLEFGGEDLWQKKERGSLAEDNRQ